MKATTDGRCTKALEHIRSSSQMRTVGRFIWIFAVTLAGLVANGCNRNTAQCEQVRAALDIGSGTTKMVVAHVNHCENRVLQVLAPAPGEKLERMVEYSKYKVNEEVVARGIDAIQELKAVALSHGATAYAAVATAAFRSVEPAYSRRVIEKIRTETGFGTTIISQDQEARLGFLATANKAGVPRDNLIVWDIGGGSMQISYWDQEENSAAGFVGNFANEAIHHFIIVNLQHKDYSSTGSPNPILSTGTNLNQPNELSRAIERAETAVLAGPSAGLRELLRSPETEVIGIGGVHFFSNCEFMKRFSADGCEFSRNELQDQAYRYAHLTDRELVEEGLSATIEFAPFRVSGAALTVGFMKAFGIERVRSIETHMGHGILLESEFWDSP